MLQTSDNRNNEIVQLQLSIGQCKLLEKLTDAELNSAETGTSSFSENALKALLDVLMAKTQATPEEKQERFGSWVQSLHLKGAQHG